jgi:Family of unknown function (DUF5317)
MGITVIAVLLGAGIGSALGGRWRHLGQRHLAAWPLALMGIGLQGIAAALAGDPGTALLLASYVALAAFCVLNLDIFGMPVILFGVLLNGVVVAVNRGMPVRRSALVAAGGAARAAHLHLTGKHHVAGPGDHLIGLADIVPLKPLHEVVAAGDLVIAAGLILVLVTLLKAPYRPRHLATRRVAGA